MKERINKLRKYMEKNGFDCVVVTDEKNVFYFSGFTGEGRLIVFRDKAVLLTDFRYIIQAKGEVFGADVADVASISLKSIISDCKKVGFEDVSISYNAYRAIMAANENIAPLGNAIMQMRAVKDESELECICRAEHIGDMAFTHILEFLRPGIKERDVALELEMYMKKSGASALSFDVIAASGENGAMPHAVPGERILQKGDFVVLDFGCVYGGYSSDMTRTVCIGKASDGQKNVYNTVLAAQTAAIGMLCSGCIPADVHNTAQKIIDEKYPGSFGHALGHGVGLDIHEMPNLSPRNTKPLASGNVVTVEPGIYLEDFCGVRIEDLVYIDNGCIQNLTNSDKNLIEI